MGVLSNSYFFARMNQIGSIVELKFYIKMQKRKKILECRKNLSS